MSKLIVIASGTHKIAEFAVNVKYRRPGNVVEYIPVKFEIFEEGTHFKAVPLAEPEARTLTNLPSEIIFQIKNHTIEKCTCGQEEVVEDLVEKLAALKDFNEPELNN